MNLFDELKQIRVDVIFSTANLRSSVHIIKKLNLRDEITIQYSWLLTTNYSQIKRLCFILIIIQFFRHKTTLKCRGKWSKVTFFSSGAKAIWNKQFKFWLFEASNCLINNHRNKWTKWRKKEPRKYIRINHNCRNKVSEMSTQAHWMAKCFTFMLIRMNSTL